MKDRQTAQKFILEELERLNKPINVLPSAKLEDEIFNRLMSRKFRKYTANDELIKRIKSTITYSVENGLPINVTFMQGGFKLWRLNEAPEVDWAELFAFMFYSEWLSRICAIYKPGIILEVYIMGFIMERISNYSREETLAYENSFRIIIDFLNKYVPVNLKIRLTNLIDRYGSEKKFWQEVDQATSKYKKIEEIILSPEEIITLDLNYRPKPGETLGHMWREENARVHNAYVEMDSKKAWREREPEIIAIPYHKGWEYGLHMGSAKDSVVKYWVGVGALRQKGETFMPTVLSPKQLENTKTITQNINIKGLEGKNFKKIRLILNE